MNKILMDAAYVPSEDVVAREIEGELVIVPLASGIGDMEDELYTLNETGQAIWRRLDGKRSLKDVARELSDEYTSNNSQEVENDVLGLAEELLKRRMIVEVPGD